jgi:hypothetical protein
MLDPERFSEVMAAFLPDGRTRAHVAPGAPRRSSSATRCWRCSACRTPHEDDALRAGPRRADHPGTAPSGWGSASTSRFRLRVRVGNQLRAGRAGPEATAGRRARSVRSSPARR